MYMLWQEIFRSKYILSVQDDPLQNILFIMSNMNDELQKLTSRIASLENEMMETKEAVLDKSMKIAVEGIQNTLSGLVDTLKDADYTYTEVLLCNDYTMAIWDLA